MWVFLLIGGGLLAINAMKKPKAKNGTMPSWFPNEIPVDVEWSAGAVEGAASNLSNHPDDFGDYEDD